MYGTYHRSAVCLTCLIDRRVEDGEQRVVLLVFCQLCGLVSLQGCAVCAEAVHQCCQLIALCLRCLCLCGFYLLCRLHFFCLCFRSCSGELAVDLCQHGQQLGCLIGLPELKVGGTLEQLAHTLRLFDTRQLYQDTARLGQLLDVRLNYTETVDTRTEYVERVLDGAVNLLADDFLHFRVGGGQGNFVFELEGREDGCQLAVGVHFTVRLDEERYEISTARFLFLSGECHRLFVVGSLVVTAQCVQDVRDGHFHRHVHTALEVKTKVDLFLTALFQGVAEPHFLCRNRVQILVLFDCVACRIFLGCLVIMCSHERERQVEGAYQCKARCQNSYKSFVLHNVVVILFVVFYFSLLPFLPLILPLQRGQGVSLYCLRRRIRSRTLHKKRAKVRKISDIRK